MDKPEQLKQRSQDITPDVLAQAGDILGDKPETLAALERVAAPQSAPVPEGTRVAQPAVHTVTQDVTTEIRPAIQAWYTLKWFRILIVSAAASGVSYGYFALTTGDQIVIDTSGEVHTVGGVLRLFLQQDRFYEGQLKLVEEAIQDTQEAWSDENERLQKIKALMAPVGDQMDAYKERLYREGRVPRPTPGELKAQELWDQASNLEELADDILRAEYWETQIRELEAIKQFLRTVSQ